MTDWRKFLVPGVCDCCGHKRIAWPPDAVIKAVQDWTAEHGRPPRAPDWSRSTPWTPPQSSARNLFGSWNNMLRAAGVVDRKPRSRATWTKTLIAEAMLDFLLREGRWPTESDWDKRDRGGAPAASTVRYVFGTWNAAKRFAGWDGKLQPRVARRKCVGCGTGMENRTDGCRQCRERMKARRRRERVEVAT